MKSHAELLKALNTSAAQVLGYAATDAGRQWVVWIDDLLAMYMDDLADVKPDELQRLQGKVAQLREMRGAISGTVQTNGRI